MQLHRNLNYSSDQLLSEKKYFLL